MADQTLSILAVLEDRVSTGLAKIGGNAVRFLQPLDAGVGKVNKALADLGAYGALRVEALKLKFERLTQVLPNLTKLAQGMGTAIGKAADAGIAGFTKLGSAIAKPLKMLTDTRTLLIGFVALFATGKVFGSLAGTSAELAQLNKVSLQVRETVEDISALKFVADQNEVSFVALARGAKDLKAAIADVVGGRGSEDQKSAFAALGIDPKSLQSLSANDALAKVASGFTRVADAGVRANIAQTLFKRAQFEILPILEQGNRLRDQLADAQRFGLVYSTQEVEAAQDLNDALGRLSASWTKLKAGIIEAIGPGAVALLDRFTGAISNLPGNIKAVGQLIKLTLGNEAQSADFVGPPTKAFAEKTLEDLKLETIDFFTTLGINLAKILAETLARGLELAFSFVRGTVVADIAQDLASAISGGAVQKSITSQLKDATKDLQALNIPVAVDPKDLGKAERELVDFRTRIFKQRQDAFARAEKVDPGLRDTNTSGTQFNFEGGIIRKLDLQLQGLDKQIEAVRRAGSLADAAKQNSADAAKGLADGIDGLAEGSQTIVKLAGEIGTSWDRVAKVLDNARAAFTRTADASQEAAETKAARDLGEFYLSIAQKIVGAFKAIRTATTGAGGEGDGALGLLRRITGAAEYARDAQVAIAKLTEPEGDGKREQIVHDFEERTKAVRAFGTTLSGYLIPILERYRDAQLRTLQVTTDLDDLKKRTDNATKDRDAAIARAAHLAEIGQITAAEARRATDAAANGVRDVLEKALAELDAKLADPQNLPFVKKLKELRAEIAKSLADVPVDTSTLGAGEGYSAGLNKLLAQTENTFELIRDITYDVGNAIATNFSHVFDGIIDGTKTAAQAFQDFASSTLIQIGQIIAQALLMQLILSAIGAVTGADTSGGFAGLFGSLFGGGKNQGGTLGGDATGPNVDSMLYAGTPGEEVIQRPSAAAYRRWAPGFLEAVNQLRVPMRFARAYSSASAATGGRANLNAGGTVPGTGVSRGLNGVLIMDERAAQRLAGGSHDATLEEASRNASAWRQALGITGGR